ncbi:MAG: hypothetical protein WBB23_16555 [Desulforhopalus sp.]
MTTAAVLPEKAMGTKRSNGRYIKLSPRSMRLLSGACIDKLLIDNYF